MSLTVMPLAPMNSSFGLVSCPCMDTMAWKSSSPRSWVLIFWKGTMDTEETTRSKSFRSLFSR